MSILKNLFSSKGATVGGKNNPETSPVKMNLEERMAFRREMLYEAIKVTMQANGILAASYKFRVVRNDKRGHQYSVMIDLSTDFLHSRSGQPEQLVAIGSAIVRNAQARYDLGVAGVYWRVNAEMQGFAKDRLAPSAESDSPDTTPGILSVDTEPEPKGMDELTLRQKYEQASADELAAFEAAWQKGQAVNVGDRIYATDLAPLEANPPSSGKPP